MLGNIRIYCYCLGIEFMNIPTFQTTFSV